MITVDQPTLEQMAATLDESSDYRVLRRFAARDQYNEPVIAPDAVPLKTALFADCETTGVDVERDYIIELSLVPFEFDADGVIYCVGEPMRWLNDPGVPIPAEIEKLTGIADGDVAGQSIDHAAVRSALQQASLVVAHKADFDRRMLERAVPEFASISWACSLTEIDWRAAGYSCMKLGHLLIEACGEFHDAHRATDDCLAGVHLLAAATIDGRRAFSHLLDSARESTVRLWAVGAPYDVKDLLKQRGYRWSDGENGRRKAWYRDVRKRHVDAEREWLGKTAYCTAPAMKTITARDRYSVRGDR